MSYTPVTGYKTLFAPLPRDLDLQVLGALADGWQPLGGGFTSRVQSNTDWGITRHTVLLCQTMVKREANHDPKTDTPRDG